MNLQESRKKHLLRIINDVCVEMVKSWKLLSQPLTIEDLESYYEASILISPLPPLPDLGQTWSRFEEQFPKILEELQSEVRVCEPFDLRFFFSFLSLIKENDVRFLRQLGEGESLKGLGGLFFDYLDVEFQTTLGFDYYEDVQNEIQCIGAILEFLKIMLGLSIWEAGLIEGYSAKLKSLISNYEREAEDLPRKEDGFEYDYDYEDSMAEFDIKGLFSDL